MTQTQVSIEKMMVDNGWRYKIIQPDINWNPLFRELKEAQAYAKEHNAKIIDLNTGEEVE